MKEVLITSFDMEIGGVERSLISLLNNFDYKQHHVDLLIYSHTGDFMPLLHLSLIYYQKTHNIRHLDKELKRFF